MPAQSNANAYFTEPNAYDNFMGRFSRPLAQQFVKTVPLTSGDRALDLGCGPGALTTELVNVLGAKNVAVVDPSPPFLETCLQRHRGITGKVGSAEAIPYDAHEFDVVLSQLVIHFVADTEQAGKEILRVTRPGGWVAASTWIFDQMELLYLFDVAARNVTGGAPPTPPAHEFREPGAISAYFTEIGLTNVAESTLKVESTYASFDDLWNTYLAGIGPLGAWMQEQSAEVRSAIREEVSRLLGEPEGAVTLRAAARCCQGRTPA